ncbi:ATP-binding protein [Candidatus Haliotispira prima]|uniref:ATP-binding protein n=1 Tax=Candidatus Haliotispira prima TaxID=3034016 RepID=A0ABY8MED1_9SPIO|nr:ATP-binding protein [Candidatus Haliotispira prima]
MNNDINSKIILDSIFVIGDVSSVDGRSVTIKVHKNKNLSHLSYNGDLIKNITVGSYVKICKGFINIIGVVEGEYIREDDYDNSGYQKSEENINRFLKASISGYLERNCFELGIKEMPLIGNEAYILNKNEYDSIHRFSSAKEQNIKIGSVADNELQHIKVSVNNLFASHIGIFGNTGSGKSNTLARLYHELYRENKENSSFREKSKFVLIDFNGEYASKETITENKVVYNLSTQKDSENKYLLDIDDNNLIEILSILLDATEKTQQPFLKRSINNKYLLDCNNLSDTKSIFRILLLRESDSRNLIKEFLESLKEVIGNSDQKIIQDIIDKIYNLKYHSLSKCHFMDINGSDTYSNNSPDKLLDNIIGRSFEEISVKNSGLNKYKYKILYKFYYEVAIGYSIDEHIRPVIRRMDKRFHDLNKIIEIRNRSRNKKNPNKSRNRKESFEVINLKDVNIEMRKVIPLLIAKYQYDKHKKKYKSDSSLHIIIDEAHNVLSYNSSRESETWKDYRLETFEEIIKEGRKFGVFLTIASQRPNDISATIISQVHNYFIHKLMNERDIEAISRTVSYLDKLSIESIPMLSVGVCFMSGLAFNLSVKVRIDLLEQQFQPKSETIKLTNIWKNTKEDSSEETSPN